MIIENLAVTDNFQVSVADTIMVAGAGLTANAVKKTWKITENNPGTAVLILNLQWNAADELPSFARSNSYISYINNLGKWIPAAQTAASECAKVAVDAGMKKIDVFVKGPGSGRESAIRTLQASGLEVLSIKDITPLPHNGCRPPKARRI